jgi:hypothetical protein
MNNSLNPKNMNEDTLKKWAEHKILLSDAVLKHSGRSLLDQLVEDESRIKRGIKMEYEDLLHSDKVIGGANYIRKSNEPDCINRHDALLLCKQLLTAIQKGRLVKMDYEDVEWAMALVEMRLGGQAKHLSKEVD